MKKENQVIILLVLVLLLIIGGTYAYFSINATSNKTGAKVTGKAGSLGNPTLKINTSKLYLNLDANLMSEANAGKTYYANENESGLALETNPNYTLATAQLPEGDEALDCTYNYKVTATVTNPITDNSDNDVKVVVGEKTMTLKELTTAGTNGIIVSGEIKNLTKGQSVSIPLTSSVTNTANTQDKLVDNSYTIKIEPYTSGDTKAFYCKIHEDILVEKLIASENLWQSGLEGDGYRYVGTGSINASANPKNFICFGTASKKECTANQDKYMYRVLGVFSDANGDSHVKLIKYKQLEKYKWSSIYDIEVSLKDSDLFTGLNNGYFLNNTTYNYMQQAKWLNKIENWIWSAVNTKTGDGSNGPSYYNSLTPSQIYLHEMNRTEKTSSVGDWASLSAKIGIMYASDYTLSLGATSMSITGSTYDNTSTFRTSWMYPTNNDSLKSYSEWTLSRAGFVGGTTYATWVIDNTGAINTSGVNMANSVRPVFYLNTDVVYSSGTGSIDDPFMIE